MSHALGSFTSHRGCIITRAKGHGHSLSFKGRLKIYYEYMFTSKLLSETLMNFANNSTVFFPLFLYLECWSVNLSGTKPNKKSNTIFLVLFGFLLFCEIEAKRACHLLCIDSMPLNITALFPR